MRSYRLLVTSLLFVGGLAAVDPIQHAPVHDKPWKETFGMTLQGKERTYVVYQDNSYLLAQPEDLSDPGFLHDKDVVVAAKLGRVANGVVSFYNMPKVVASGPMELWRTRIDGDNLYVFGRFTVANNVQRFAISAAETAPSDQQIIDKKIAGIPAENFDARLAAANWAREMGMVQGNREFWLVAADNIISQVVDDVVAKAEAGKDVALILKAMGWCQDLLRDIPRAARIGSAAWIRQVGGAGAEDVAKYMRRWDLEFYGGQWRPRGEALGQEFQDRFAAIGWRDAEGYYKLGRWADANAEVLPRSRELSYRAYQAGFRADNNHNGIRRELGMEPAKAGSGAGSLQGEFKDTLSGISIPTPPGWNRADPIGGDATWIDPTSDTAYITAKILRNQTDLNDFAGIWASQVSSAQGKADFMSIAEEKLTLAKGQAKILRYSYREGRYQRMAALVVAVNPAANSALRLDANGADTEAEAVTNQLNALFSQVIIPDASSLPGAKSDGDSKKPGTAPTPVPVPQAEPQGDAAN
ncbi:MAG: hypothetical protein H0W78_02660 [Planctomycetes bacterium]|nr:hypothetical protein [Planctomycetota bacterium]